MADITIKTADDFEDIETLFTGSMKKARAGRAGTLLAGGDEYRLEPGMMARIGPGEKRKITTGSEGVRILALGGTPGRAFEPPGFSEESAPD